MLIDISETAWNQHQKMLAEAGYTLLPAVIKSQMCQELAGLYEDETLYRKTIVMQRHGYGSGEYRYFNYPLHPLVDQLRHELYPRLAPVANDWNQKIGEPIRYPADLDVWLDVCHAAGQSRPTPLILRYGAGDWNALHQDIYGELHFPFQAVLFLNQPETDYTGGELVLVEQRPRMQSKATVLQPKQGQILLFTTKTRPVRGAKGYYRVAMRHGVSEVKSGNRVNLGLIFHDAL